MEVVINTLKRETELAKKWMLKNQDNKKGIDIKKQQIVKFE